LWDRYGDGDLKKQLEPEYLMKSAEEKARLEYKSISISQSTPKPIENRIEEGLNSKKRKRDELERKEETKTKEPESNAFAFSSYLNEGKPTIELKDFFQMPITSEAKDGFGSQNRYNNQQFGGNENIGISEENMALPRDNIVFTEPNSDSMIIEELLEAELKKKNEQASSNKNLGGDQSWNNFSKMNESEREQTFESQTPTKNMVDQTLPEVNGELNFYYIDIFEDPKDHPGDVFLFGKVQKNRFVYESCCIIVKNVEREVYLVPSEYNGRGNTQNSDENPEDINCDFEAIIKEFMSKLPPSHQKKLKFKPVERTYSFELPILHGKRNYLKVKYDGHLAPISQTLKGNTFSHVIGTTWTLLENFIVKKRLMGPQWLKISNFKKVGVADKKSWCQHELIIDFKSVAKLDQDIAPANPPIKVLSFALKNAKVNDNWEIAAISALTFNKVDTDKNIEINAKELETSMFSIVRKLPGTSFPKDFDAQARNFKKYKIKAEESEVALINNFIGQIGAFDPDVITVHDAYTSALDTLLNRIKKLRISNWSKLSRLKKTYQIETSNLFRVRHATSGRLICDTFLSSREFVRETNYSLTHLARNLLGQTRDDFDENSTSLFYRSSEYLIKMADHTTQDAFITSAIMFHLQIIPITKHLTCLAGNTWIKSLQNARAERNEMLLIHEFRKRKYIYPDKYNSKNDDKYVFETEDDNKVETKKTSKKEKNKYAGGLVLDPKPGLYTNLILLLDFNSLYPSIIQEYDICWTTLQIPPKALIEASSNKKNESATKNNQKIEIEEENKNEEISKVPIINIQDEELNMIKRIDNPESVLPTVIKRLVNQRKHVKDLLKGEKNEAKRENLDIKQKAIKLIANSMYGCLGFANSRFYAKPIAATITRYGRQILEDSARKVEEKTGMKVIYGDTDSLMIDSSTNKISDAIELGNKIKKEINDKYKCLEIEIDGIFMPLLLLKKKKYAAMKLNNLGDFLRPGSGRDCLPHFKQEVKGVDIVRRDWSLISKKASAAVLKEIFSGKSIDDVIDGIKTEMTNLANRVREDRDGGCTLDEFIITKQLTKDPSKYPNDKGQPHVQVAKRMLEKGNKNANLVHHYIPYVIIKSDKEGLGERAVHPAEFKESNGQYKIDREWYLSQQIMPPVQRLLEVIPGIIISEIAKCLGLDEARYKHTRKNDDDGDTNDYVVKIINNFEATNEDQIEFNVRCTKCKNVQKIIQKPKGSNEQFSMLVCPDPQCRGTLNQTQIFNLVKLKVKDEVSKYYKHILICRECQIEGVKRFSFGDLKCNQGHKLIEKKSRDVIGWLRSLKAMFALSKEESSKFSSTQIEFLNVVERYIGEVIKLSKADSINFGLIFAKNIELNIK